ncbi:unnamed protein product [Polarella glacialis]|nr:unnamed protein product [Polarella glacialis]
MTRALQTAFLINGKSQSDSRWLVSGMCAERLSGATCDEGTPKSELVQRLTWMHHWPGVEELDEEWWKADRPEEELRVADFLDFLQSRPEQKIIVVSHGAFLESIVGYHMNNAQHHLMSITDSEGAKQKLRTSSFNLNFAVDSEYEALPLKTLAKEPLNCLKGFSRRKAALLAAIGPKTVCDLASWKYARWAESICTLAPAEQDGLRDLSHVKHGMNINHALIKDWEGYSMSDLLGAPLSAFEGLTEPNDVVFKSIGIGSIKELGTWKFYSWSRAICALAEVESADGSS